MWIRSQDRKILINGRVFRLNENYNNQNDIDNYYIDADNYDEVLGYYSTYEKALKVLDEIESSIYLCEISIRTNERPYAQNLIYQMPQDSEV